MRSKQAAMTKYPYAYQTSINMYSKQVYMTKHPYA